jgi:hypothetical protein
MPDPALIDVLGDDFTKVATAVRSGYVHIKNTSPHYVYTYRLTGEDAPVYPDDLDECVDFEGQSMPICNLELIDVYLATAKDDGGGKVRVDL